MSKTKLIKELREQLKEVESKLNVKPPKVITEEWIRSMNLLGVKKQGITFKLDNLMAGRPMLGDSISPVDVVPTDRESKKFLHL